MHGHIVAVEVDVCVDVPLGALGVCVYVGDVNYWGSVDPCLNDAV